MQDPPDGVFAPAGDGHDGEGPHARRHHRDHRRDRRRVRGVRPVMGRRELFAVSSGGLLLGTANTVLACTPYIGPKPVPINLSRSEEHTSELQSLMRISYAVFCLKKK